MWFSALVDLVGWIYPPYCKLCDQPLQAKDAWCCMHCLWALDTTFASMPVPAFTEKVQGEAWLAHSFALAPSSKGTPIHRLIHLIKYHNQAHIAYEIGSYYGRLLQAHPDFPTLDMILAVPLHPQRERSRGYNQSQLLAEGLAKVLHLPCPKDLLIRTIATTSQTKKNRQERWANVNKAFACPKPTALKNKKIGLIDDVITTGATLAACTKMLLAHGAKEVTAAVLGLASFV